MRSAKTDMFATKYMPDTKTHFMLAQHNITNMPEEQLAELTKFLGLGKFVYANEITVTTLYQEETYKMFGTKGMTSKLLAVVSELANGNYNVTIFGDSGIYGLICNSTTAPFFIDDKDSDTKIDHNGQSITSSFAKHEVLSSQNDIYPLFTKFYAFQGKLAGTKSKAYRDYLNSQKNYFASMIERENAKIEAMLIKKAISIRDIQTAKSEEEKNELLRQIDKLEQEIKTSRIYLSNATEILYFLEKQLLAGTEKNNGEQYEQ